MKFSDGDKVTIIVDKIPLVYVRKGGAWHLMVLTDFLIDAYVTAGKATLG